MSHRSRSTSPRLEAPRTGAPPRRSRLRCSPRVVRCPLWWVRTSAATRGEAGIRRLSALTAPAPSRRRTACGDASGRAPNRCRSLAPGRATSGDAATVIEPGEAERTVGPRGVGFYVEWFSSASCVAAAPIKLAVRLPGIEDALPIGGQQPPAPVAQQVAQPQAMKPDAHRWRSRSSLQTWHAHQPRCEIANTRADARIQTPLPRGPLTATTTRPAVTAQSFTPHWTRPDWRKPLRYGRTGLTPCPASTSAVPPTGGRR